ncbi:uncharacterized protein K441DRAFT_121246 [Cenococcum geophilum 1.58]|uniref:uncharacterized protein n=1 Tax=Cenococcum geophilum 1.58 TaxID=794803 RepID=UPI00358EE7E0|nr:hypothetical protein K441DRAFT_121246 [Cenococcum geophilum 1.58]
MLICVFSMYISKRSPSLHNRTNIAMPHTSFDSATSLGIVGPLAAGRKKAGLKSWTSSGALVESPSTRRRDPLIEVLRVIVTGIFPGSIGITGMELRSPLDADDHFPGRGGTISKSEDPNRLGSNAIAGAIYYNENSHLIQSRVSFSTTSSTSRSGANFWKPWKAVRDARRFCRRVPNHKHHFCFADAPPRPTKPN